MPVLPDKDDLESGDILAVISDLRSGREYYVSPIDNFSLNGHDYSVMYNYVPSGDNNKNELVVMRRYQEGSDTYYGSIRNKKESKEVFNYFFSRYREYKEENLE